jgi:hypothetical protein
LIVACVIASSLALMNARYIPMISIVRAAAVSWLRSATEDASLLVLDPSEAESRAGVGCGCFAFSFAADTSGSQQSPNIPSAQLTWTDWHTKGGVFDEEEFARAQAFGLRGAEVVWESYQGEYPIPQMDAMFALPPLGQSSAEI